jgi:DNA-binding MarR family transcriptional regulator
MEKRGLVERRLCNEDARGTWVGMTPDGSRAVLGAMRDHAATLRRHFFDVLTPEELEVFRVASARVLETIEPVPCDD